MRLWCGLFALARWFFIRYDSSIGKEERNFMSQDTPFTNYLFRLRTSRGYSQKQLAALLGLRLPKAVSDFEAGRRLPPLPLAMTLEIVLGAKLSEIYPDLYRTLGQQAVDREDRLPPRFSRHIRGRVLGKESDAHLGHGGRESSALPPQDSPPVRGLQHRLPF
jgi:transcriptional regulator with XRE-family HTH domain